jgi:hypothetical protein
MSEKEVMELILIFLGGVLGLGTAFMLCLWLEV